MGKPPSLGDLLLELNGYGVRYSSKCEVLELLKQTKKVLRLVVIAGGLKAPHIPNTWGKRYHKARVFHSKVSKPISIPAKGQSLNRSQHPDIMLFIM